MLELGKRKTKKDAEKEDMVAVGVKEDADERITWRWIIHVETSKGSKTRRRWLQMFCTSVSWKGVQAPKARLQIHFLYKCRLDQSEENPKEMHVTVNVDGDC